MWPNLQETADLVTFTEEILDRKIHFLCSDLYLKDHFLLEISANLTRQLVCELS